ncbi:fip1-like 1 protein [Anaeramoeba flamelloides]|uniref:Fip1-like 1 protein n=1 Tax=Anaeramoeba flamelloides TaxID=1746091 RepID=A0AAV7ZS71_9EUKA|nr:fip1-like 1 protein [Anaeramoeba flamelloides]
MGNIETLPVVAKQYQNFKYGLLKNTKKAFCVCDETSTILDANDNFAKLFKTEKKSLISTKLISPNIDQKQYSLSSLDFIKMVSSLIKNVKGSQTYQCCFQRPNKEMFYASTQICLGNLNGKVVFRAIIKEISDPTLMRFDQFVREDEEGMSINMVDVHLNKIKNALFNSEIGGTQKERDLAYHLYCISQHSRLNQITNKSQPGKVFTVLILRKKNVQEVAHLTISREKLCIQTLREQKEIDDTNEIILQIHSNRKNLLKLEYPDDQLTLAFPSEFNRTQFINTLKFAFDPNYDPFFGEGAEMEGYDEIENEEKEKEIEEQEEEEEKQNVSLIKKAFSSKNPKSVSSKNQNMNLTKSLGGLLNSKTNVIENGNDNKKNVSNVQNENHSKKEDSLGIKKKNKNEEKENENEEIVSTKTEKEKTKTKGLKTNNKEITKGKGTEKENLKENENEKEKEREREREREKEKEKEKNLSNNQNENKNDITRIKKAHKFTHSGSGIISKMDFDSMIKNNNDFTQEFSVFVKKQLTNVLERGTIYLGGGVLRLKTKTTTENLKNAKEEIKVIQDDMWYRKVTIEFLKKQTLYYVTFNETETANEFLKYYQELIIDFDSDGQNNSLNSKDETLLEFLKTSGDSELPISNNNQTSETMSMFEFLTLSEGWELHNVNNANNSPKMPRRNSYQNNDSHNNKSLNNNNQLIKKPKIGGHRTEFNAKVYNGANEKKSGLTVKFLENKYLLLGKKKILIKKIIIHQQQSLPKVCQIEIIKNKRRRKTVNQYLKNESMDNKNINQTKELDLKKVPIDNKAKKKNNNKKLMISFLKIEEKKEFMKEFNYITENINNSNNRNKKSKNLVIKKKKIKRRRDQDKEKRGKNEDKKNEKNEEHSNKKKGTTFSGIFKRKESRRNAKLVSRNRTRSFSLGRSKRPIFENKNINSTTLIPNLISAQTVRNLYQNNNNNENKNENEKNKQEGNVNNNVRKENNNLSDSLIIEGEKIQEVQEIEEFTLKIFTYKQVWVTGKIQFLDNNEIVLITPEKELSSSQGNVFRLIQHPTRIKISKLKIDIFNFILKFNSSTERENFSTIFEKQYLSNKKLFEIMIFWSNIQNKEIKRLNAKIRIHHEELIINTMNKKKLIVPIVKDLKISLNPTRKALIKIDLPNAEFCVLSFSDPKELSIFVKILKKIMLIL